MQTQFKYNIDIDYTAIWTPVENGKFTIASAWEVIRKKRPKNIINKSVWHKHIPFKIAFFIWSALRGKLPTNEYYRSLEELKMIAIAVIERAQTTSNTS